RSQMKAADKSGAPYSLIIGEDELQSGQITLREMNTGVQRQLEWQSLPESILELL
ncbi:MAG: histidine--tRNA ligase, partial [Candidatus Cloacimonetes bacterium]|nr:histidine--tRNA ligase [Candidatus Cloacimonadota bacterium]